MRSPDGPTWPVIPLIFGGIFRTVRLDVRTSNLVSRTVRLAIRSSDAFSNSSFCFIFVQLFSSCNLPLFHLFLLYNSLVPDKTYIQGISSIKSSRSKTSDLHKLL